MTEHKWLAPGEHGFLTGDTLYLRPIELADARHPEAWRDSIFPISPQRAEEILKDDIPKDAMHRKHRMVACRKSDDKPVGAATYETEGELYTYIRAHADPALDDEQATPIIAEILSIIVPWRLLECHNVTVWAELDAPTPELLAAVAAIEMHPAACYREAIWHRGARHNQWVYERLHPGWVERIGDPGPGIEVATDPPAETPHARRVSLRLPEGDIPDNALLVSERLVLRPTRPDDWQEGSRLLRRETETFFNNGRWLPSPIVAGSWITDSQKADPPRNIELSVILRETGAVIGTMSMFHIDLVHGTAETGAGIFEVEMRGKGLGSEAKLLLLEYAFDFLGLHAVRSFVWGPNTRSQAALRKQGYRDAGSFRWTSLVGADFVDTRTFDLLASEWRARANQAGA